MRKGEPGMLVSQIMAKMIAFPEGNIHDVDHLIRVWTYARTIGELENVGDETRLILETAAIVHDIACPLCREKYGSTNGKYQEMEGGPMARAFLEGTGLTDAQIDRVAFLVAHHHTLTGIDGQDWQILIEADTIANASEKGYEREKLLHIREKVFRTQSGKALLDAVFCL